MWSKENKRERRNKKRKIAIQHHHIFFKISFQHKIFCVVITDTSSKRLQPPTITNHWRSCSLVSEIAGRWTRLLVSEPRQPEGSCPRTWLPLAFLCGTPWELRTGSSWLPSCRTCTPHKSCAHHRRGYKRKEGGCHLRSVLDWRTRGRRSTQSSCASCSWISQRSCLSEGCNRFLVEYLLQFLEREAALEDKDASSPS